jgi:hypothetical protein
MLGGSTVILDPGSSRDRTWLGIPPGSLAAMQGAGLGPGWRERWLDGRDAVELQEGFEAC